MEGRKRTWKEERSRWDRMWQEGGRRKYGEDPVEQGKKRKKEGKEEEEIGGNIREGLY